MLVIPRYQGDGLWIGPVFLRVMRLRERASDGVRIAELGIEADRSFPIIRAEHLRDKSDQELQALGYRQVAEGLIVPSESMRRAA